MNNYKNEFLVLIFGGLFSLILGIILILSEPKFNVNENNCLQYYGGRAHKNIPGYCIKYFLTPLNND